MQPNYNISIRFDEPLILAWKAFQLQHPGQTLSGVTKTLLRAFLEDSGAMIARPKTDIDRIRQKD